MMLAVLLGIAPVPTRHCRAPILIHATANHCPMRLIYLHTEKYMKLSLPSTRSIAHQLAHANNILCLTSTFQVWSVFGLLTMALPLLSPDQVCDDGPPSL